MTIHFPSNGKKSHRRKNAKANRTPQNSFDMPICLKPEYLDERPKIIDIGSMILWARITLHSHLSIFRARLAYWIIPKN